MSVFKSERLGSKPYKKSGVEPLRRSGVRLDTLPAAPAAKLMPNVLLCSPLDNISKAERVILTTGLPRISIHSAQALRPGEVTSVPPLKVAETTREVAVTSDKPFPIGVGYGRYGLPLTVGGTVVSHW